MLEIHGPTHLTCTVCLLNILVYVISLITYTLCLVPWSPVSCRLSCVLRVVVPFINPCCLILQAMPRPPQSPRSCILSTPICPFTGSVQGQKEKPFYKNINANLISAAPPPAHHYPRLSRQRGPKEGEGDNQLIWSSALGNGERKRSWGMDIHLLGMIELRTEWELERREGWRNEVVWVTEEGGARAWETQ